MGGGRNMCYHLTAVTFVKALNPWDSCVFGNVLYLDLKMFEEKKRTVKKATS